MIERFREIRIYSCVLGIRWMLTGAFRDREVKLSEFGSLAFEDDVAVNSFLWRLLQVESYMSLALKCGIKVETCNSILGSCRLSDMPHHTYL